MIGLVPTNPKGANNGLLRNELPKNGLSKGNVMHQGQWILAEVFKQLLPSEHGIVLGGSLTNETVELLDALVVSLELLLVPDVLTRLEDGGHAALFCTFWEKVPKNTLHFLGKSAQKYRWMDTI